MSVPVQHALATDSIAQAGGDRTARVGARRADGDAKERIRERLDIAEIIGETVDLKSTGTGRLEALCPFHGEKTPSFKVDTEKGLYHCFGCNAGGDVFDFVMRTQGVEFGEALQVLGQRAGIEVTPSTPKDLNKRDLYEVNKLALEFFRSHLPGVAEDYLLSRKLTKESIAAFELGFAPESWDALIKHALTKGVKDADLLRAGLLAEAESGRRYDRFRNRVIFPIKDFLGRVVGFSGRVLDDSLPKYVNTPETDVFRKGELLYGLDTAKHTVRATGECLVVEGYMDVIALHQTGFGNAVGVQGSALTEPQISRLERLGVMRLTLGLDGDEAGQRATLNALNNVRRRFEIKVADLGGADPAEIVQKNPKNFSDALEFAQTEAAYRYTTALKDVDPRTDAGRNVFLERLKPALGDRGRPGSGGELRALVVEAVGADVTTADLKSFAEGVETTIDVHLEAADDAELRQRLVRNRVAGEVQTFPLEVLPVALQKYVSACATALPVPNDFVAAPMLAVLATAIGHSRKIVIKKSWHEGARVWIALVAEPGSRKTPALSKANEPIHFFQKALKQQHDTDAAAYASRVLEYESSGGKKSGNTSEPPGDEPELKQVLTTDATVEALIALHSKNKRSLLFSQDELSGWVAGMDQYKAGRGNDRQKWLSSWSGDAIIVNRKGKVGDMLAEPHISVSGGIQPDVLPSLQNAHTSDGFIDRILFSYPKTLSTHAGFQFYDDVGDDEVAGYRKITGALWKLEQVETADGLQPKPLQMTDAAKRVFADWMDAHNVEKNEAGLDKRLVGAWGKLDGYFARFALILHLAAFAAGEEKEETISALSVGKAADLIQYFKSHAAQVYRQLGNSAEDKALRALYDYIARLPDRRCTPRDLTRAGLPGCSSTKAVLSQLEKVSAAGLGTLEVIKTASGQKRNVFTLNDGGQGVG